MLYFIRGMADDATNIAAHFYIQINLIILQHRRDGRVVDRGGLENR